MVQIDMTILATTKITPSKIATGESQACPFTQELTIENDGDSAVTYNLSFVNALSVSNTFAPAFYLSDGSVSFNSPSVTVPAGGTATVDATINPPTDPDKDQYGGYIVFTPEYEGEIYRVPFAVFVGDYQRLQVLKPTAYGFLWLSYIYGTSYTKLTVPQTILSPCRAVIYPNCCCTWITSLAYSGSKSLLRVVSRGNGVISLLKANSDASNPADWESWTSPNFIIARP